MVVKMMRWRPRPSLVSKKYEVKLIVRRLEGWDLVGEGWEKPEKLKVEIRWKGPKASLSSLRRTVKRNFTKEVDSVDENGVIVWDEEFQTLCNLSAYKENAFHPWEIVFSALNGLKQGPKSKVPVVGVASLNLAEHVSAAEQKELELNIPLILSTGAGELYPRLCISLSLLELRIDQEINEPIKRALVPFASPLQSGETVTMEKDEISTIKAGLRKVKFFRESVSTRGAKKACREDEGSEGRCSARGDDGEYPLDTDSLDDSEEGESDEVKDDSVVRKSFSYGTLADANYAGGSVYSSMRISEGDEDWVYYSNRKSDVSCSNVEDSAKLVSEPSLLQSSKRSILSWRKRKLSFRSPKGKGEPLLKKGYGEEGGDDIDFDHDDSSVNCTSISEFGDDSFAVGNWEQKEVVSRYGRMKLKSEVFFASIDQRTLVAVIADWLQNNRDLMPIKSQFDSLIREGSLEWRKLCENESYREWFPDKHFDLETVLQSKLRPLSVVPKKSFIGFDFLHGAMSFDNIWDEISRAGAECQNSDLSEVYIVDPEAYYIIDTLGERLYEGCNQAYILKFDRNTVIHKLPNVAQSSGVKSTGDQQVNGKEGCVAGAVVTKPEKSIKSEDSEEEYMSFLAAIPIRELQSDIKKGLMASTPLHHRLQIKFHYTEFSQPLRETSASPMTTSVPLVEVPLTEIAT
ncbi:hypothetical protein E1A91_D06G142900v1 [Gossypium mustelinum]|uniref:C2 NT-type domain-containing protein n=1 Tax=Gossypium mustelinum TaxID=34275 RepID=A0A5D2UJF9_GOSMU|nr:hypothetical protein E1A91_D06G142900v1 [Gossypium mustelinum]